VRSGIYLVKYWFSVDDEEPERPFQGSASKIPPQTLEAQPMTWNLEALGGVFQSQGTCVCAHDRRKHLSVVTPMTRNTAPDSIVSGHLLDIKFLSGLRAGRGSSFPPASQTNGLQETEERSRLPHFALDRLSKKPSATRTRRAERLL